MISFAISGVMYLSGIETASEMEISIKKTSREEIASIGNLKLIIEKDKIGDRKVFKLAHKEKTIILVRLDAAESLLRRNVKGIKLTRVKGE